MNNVRFEWNQSKDFLNKERHGISFNEAKEIFLGITFTVEDIRRDYGERRFKSIGMIENTILIVVAHTLRDGSTRIISARKANKKERETFYVYLKESFKKDSSY